MCHDVDRVGPWIESYLGLVEICFYDFVYWDTRIETFSFTALHMPFHCLAPFLSLSSLTLTLFHTHSLTLTLSLSRTHSLSLTHTLSLSLSHSSSLSLSPSIPLFLHKCPQENYRSIYNLIICLVLIDYNNS